MTEIVAEIELRSDAVSHVQIVEHGTHDELMQLDGRYAELFTMQASAYFPELMRVQAR